MLYAYGVDHANCLFVGGCVILSHGKPGRHLMDEKSPVKLGKVGIGNEIDLPWCGSPFVSANFE